MASLMQDLQRALTLEAKFQPRLQLPTGNSNGGVSLSFLIFLFLIFYYMSLNYFQETGGEITSQMRDGAAHVLRCLKVWYDLPSSVLLAALNLMDRYDIFTSLFGNCNVNLIFFFFHSGSSVG